VAALLRGPEGSAVEVTLAPRGPGAGGPPVELLLERRSLPQPAVREARLPLAAAAPSSAAGGTSGAGAGGEVAYVRVNYFSSDTTPALARALRAGEADGVAGFVLDLRNNPGAARGGGLDEGLLRGLRRARRAASRSWAPPAGAAHLTPPSTLSCRWRI
jgi:carboxyl-terminal processing protease